MIIIIYHGKNYRKYHEDKNPDIQPAQSNYDEADISRLREMDNGGNTDELLALGDIFAAQDVQARIAEGRDAYRRACAFKNAPYGSNRRPRQ